MIQLGCTSVPLPVSSYGTISQSAILALQEAQEIQTLFGQVEQLEVARMLLAKVAIGQQCPTLALTQGQIEHATIFTDNFQPCVSMVVAAGGKNETQQSHKVDDMTE